MTSTKINVFRLGGDADSVLSGFNFALLFTLAMVYFLMISIRAHEVFGCFFFGEQVCRPCVMVQTLYFILVHGHFTTVLLIAREKLRAFFAEVKVSLSTMLAAYPAVAIGAGSFFRGYVPRAKRRKAAGQEGIFPTFSRTAFFF